MAKDKKKDKTWQKYKYAGEVKITTSNYPDATKEEICNALQGTFPTKPTDIMRLCPPEQLCIDDMIDLLHQDYETYMSYCNPINHFVLRFLRNSDLCHRSFLKIRDLLDNAVKLHLSDEEVLAQIKGLSFSVIGRDIFKREIDIIDGLDASSYFWIEATRIIDYTDTNDSNNVATMKNVAFSINNEDVAKYILPFLYKYFDNKLEANKMRIDHHDGDWPAEDDETDENGDWPLEYVDYLSGGGGTYNFFYT